MKHNIENYESMTTEEKLAALEAYEPDMSGWVRKDTFDKTASELASLKKSSREKMSEDEAKAIEAAEKLTAALERAEKAEHALAVNNYVKSYLAMGYDEKLAESSAEALSKGDMDTVFKNQKVHAENQAKALKAELLKQTPNPPSGSPDQGKTKEDFSKMSLSEKQQFAKENPELYKSYYAQ